MTTDRDRKTYWDLFEAICWIRYRDEEKVTAIWGKSDQEKWRSVMSAMKVEIPIDSPPGPSGSTRGAVMRAAPPEENQFVVEAQNAFQGLLQKVQSRRVHMTAINCCDTRERQIEVPLAELSGLQLRIVSDYSGPVAGLWSRSSDALAWKSPQFLRSDVIGAWPAPNTKTATVSAAILRHLRQIMTPEAALTKPEARQRCLDEVPNGIRPPSIARGSNSKFPTREDVASTANDVDGLGKRSNETSGEMKHIALFNQITLCHLLPRSRRREGVGISGGEECCHPSRRPVRQDR